jgi:hypothetical protein
MSPVRSFIDNVEWRKLISFSSKFHNNKDLNSSINEKTAALTATNE